jgi:hypothetical protein
MSFTAKSPSRRTAFQPELDPRYIEYMAAQSQRNPRLYNYTTSKQAVKEWNVGHELLLGYTDQDMQGEPITISTYDNFGTRKRITIFIVAPAGSGKTKLIKNLMVQIKMMHDAPLILCDPRLEQMDARNPPLRDQHFPVGFVPRGLDIKTYVPEYCYADYNDEYNPATPKMKAAHKFNISMADITIDDMLTLMQVQKDDKAPTVNFVNALEDAWDIFIKRVPDKSQRTIAQFIQCVEALEPKSGQMKTEVHPDTYKKLYRSTVRLAKKKIIGTNTIDITADIRAGAIPVISNKDSMSSYFDSAYASVVTHPVYRLRQNVTQSYVKSDYKIPPVWYIIDEAQRVAFTGSCFANFLVNSIIRNGRTSLQHVVCATQMILPPPNMPTEVSHMEIDPRIPAKCEYIICFKLDSQQDIEYIIDCMNIIDKDDFRAMVRELVYDPNKWLAQAILIKRSGVFGSEAVPFFPLPAVLAGHRFESDI